MFVIGIGNTFNEKDFIDQNGFNEDLLERDRFICKYGIVEGFYQPNNHIIVTRFTGNGFNVQNHAFILKPEQDPNFVDRKIAEFGGLVE